MKYVAITPLSDCACRIPPPKVQQFTYMSDVISDAIALGIVAFAISVSMAKILAKKHDYEIDSNQVSFQWYMYTDMILIIGQRYNSVIQSSDFKCRFCVRQKTLGLMPGRART